MDAIIGTAFNFVIKRTFNWIKGMPRLSAKVRHLKAIFPDFEGHDEFVKGCGQAMEALQTMSNQRDIVGARGCMTDAMFDMWQQAIALADSEDHSIDVTQSRVLNACVVNVAIDDLEAPPPPSISLPTPILRLISILAARHVTLRSLSHTSTCCCTPPKPKSSRLRTQTRARRRGK